MIPLKGEMSSRGLTRDQNLISHLGNKYIKDEK